jgi:uncharacterized protein DUF4886
MTKILTIGNSYSQNATRYMDDFMKADSSVDLLYGKANFGGCSLEKHWNVVKQCELLSEVRPYDFSRPAKETVSATLKEALSAEDWDFVTLQQVSHLSWQRETYEPFFGNLYNLVKEFAPRACPVIHQIWADRADSHRVAEWEITQKIMFEKLKENYAVQAERYGCPILPSGEALQKARAIFEYIPDQTYDFENTRPLELPDQTRSLSVGWYWRTGNTPSGNAELVIDAGHCNSKGCYLANAVWYEMFTGKKAADNLFCPEDIRADELKVLQAVATETVAEYNGPLA